MGIRHLAHVLYDMGDLDPTAKLILLAIADHINDETGWGWPSVTRLAAVAGVHRSNVVRWLERLEQSGYIDVKRRPGKANHYRLTSSASATSGPGCTSSAGATGLVAPAHTTSSAGATRTRKNPKGTIGRPAANGPAATPTPPPLALVLAQQEAYR